MRRVLARLVWFPPAATTIRACGCRDRRQARAPWGGCPPLAWPRFLKLLYEPGRSDFPSPILVSALHAIRQITGLPADREAQALARVHPSRRSSVRVLVAAPNGWPGSGSGPFRGRVKPDLMPGHVPRHHCSATAEYPGLLCPPGALPAVGRTSRVLWVRKPDRARQEEASSSPSA